MDSGIFLQSFFFFSTSAWLISTDWENKVVCIVPEEKGKIKEQHQEGYLPAVSDFHRM